MLKWAYWICLVACNPATISECCWPIFNSYELVVKIEGKGQQMFFCETIKEKTTAILKKNTAADFPHSIHKLQLPFFGCFCCENCLDKETLWHFMLSKLVLHYATTICPSFSKTAF